MKDSKIQWTDATWNPVKGCSRVSEGCRNCYAERVAARFSGEGMPYAGFVRKGKWTGELAIVEDKLLDPLRWQKPRRIFVNSMSDLFHESLPDEAIDRVFAVMALARTHTFQVLTKRPRRMKDYLDGRAKSVKFWRDAAPRGYALQWEHEGRTFPLVQFPLPNVWLGVSVEDQATADARIPDLLSTPAALRFISYEPALGPVDFSKFLHLKRGFGVKWRVLVEEAASDAGPRLDWIIVGGESGPGARPFNVKWALETITQCEAAGVKCFVKQLGSYWATRSGASRVVRSGPNRARSVPRDSKGGNIQEWPDDLRVREFPASKAAAT